MNPATNPDTLPRSPVEIVERIRTLTTQGTDPQGIERSRLLEALPFDNAVEFLRETRSRESWRQVFTTVSEVRAEVRDYLGFAWRKANACRGTSVLRALANFRGLLWLAASDAYEHLSTFRYYGKVELVTVSNAVAFDWRAVDNDQWVRDAGDEPLTAAQALEAVSDQDV